MFVDVWFAEIIVGLLVVAYLFFMTEPYHLINKAEISMVAGALTFFFIGVYSYFFSYRVGELHGFMEGSLGSVLELVLFLWISMIFIEFLIERQVFDALRDWIFSKRLTYRQIYWFIGLFGFFLSAVVNNLTTALILAAVIVSVDNKNKDFMTASAVSAVVASNAGGVWSAFGDVTSLMAWNAAKASFFDFFYLFPACFMGWLFTAVLMLAYIPKGYPKRQENAAPAKIQKGGCVGIFLGLISLVLAVAGQAFFDMPTVWGMLTGLAFFLLYGELNKKSGIFDENQGYAYRFVRNIDFQTLFFFIGILTAVDGLSFLRQLDVVARLYDRIEPSVVNSLIGLVSALIDNVPVLQVILSASPEMDKAQWLLLVLTTGTGGSLLVLGSAAGIAIMGKMPGVYTFATHLKKSWAIAAGYVLSVGIWLVQVKIWPSMFA